MMYVLLIIGFILLIKGADLFVDGASSIARILKIPSIIIGLTIVAMGTSAPEAAVSLTASLSQSNDISLGNIIGSNIFNLLAVIGVCAIIKPIPSPKEIISRDLWWNLAVSIGLFVFLLNGSLGRIEGIILLLFFIGYLLIIIRHAKNNRIDTQENPPLPLLKSIGFVLFGLAAIIYGGTLVVDNASLIATSLGMSDTLVGLTIVAIGTSLPELITSIVASLKQDSGLALGNAVGSCLFNILFILGTTSLIASLAAANELIIDSGILILVGIILLIFCKSKTQTSRIEGIICVLAYIAYSCYIIIR